RHSKAYLYIATQTRRSRKRPNGRKATRWHSASTPIVSIASACVGYSEISRSRFQNGTMGVGLIGLPRAGWRRAAERGGRISALRQRPEHAAQQRAPELVAGVARGRLRHRLDHALAAPGAEQHALGHVDPAAARGSGVAGVLLRAGRF